MEIIAPKVGSWSGRPMELEFRDRDGRARYENFAEDGNLMSGLRIGR